MLRAKKKTPAELVRQIRDAVTIIEKQSPSERSNSKVTKSHKMQEKMGY